MDRTQEPPAATGGRDRRLSATRASAGTLLQFVRDGSARSRAQLADVAGLGRSTVSQRVGLLIERQLLNEVGEGESTGGRPPMILEFNPRAGLVLAADLGATHSRLAVVDLAGTPLAERSDDIDIGEGPEIVLPWAIRQFEELLDEVGGGDDEVVGIGVGVPGPVEFRAGRTVNPPIMPGWDGVPIREPFESRWPVPVLVDNDVNIMAMGEYWTHWRHVDDLLFVKLGTGIGAGIVVGGQIHRGAQGAAGDIGHVRLSTAAATCRCGNEGCLEAVAGGGALSAALRAEGRDVTNTRDVVELVRAGDTRAAQLVREAGRALGEVLAGVINFLNPAVIVLGGDLAHAHQQIFAGVREICYQRSTALATRHLEFARSRLDDEAGITGAAVMAIEHVLSPEAVDRALAAASA
ncbi:MAG: ROK family protein [Nitriliruptorales bacterium]|nr:ROK family protein [Nitriliruptorales bacterium]